MKRLLDVLHCLCSRIAIASAFAGMFLTVAPIGAQSFTASLQGTVTDASGAVVPAAQIAVTNEKTNVTQQSQSNERGVYFFALLPPGVYRLTAEHPGFKTVVRSGMTLQVQQQAVVDILLTPGEVASSIEVSGEAPRLDAVNATLGRVVENKSVLNMPLNTRNTLDLAILAPGIVGSSGGTGTNFVSNGVRNSQSDVLLDGVTVATHEQGGGATDAKVRPSVELVQEFKVQTNSFSAEYGFTGGTVINMVTRSGTNEFHGSLFEFMRNSALNANSFFSNRSGRKLVPWRRNQFGGAIGGPVSIPHVYNGRNRTFFFFHAEETRQTGNETTLVTVPSVLQKQGNFTDKFDSQGRLISIYDPFSVTQNAAGNWTRVPFSGNIIPSSRLNPVGAAVVKFYPDPNLPGNPLTQANNYFNSGSQVTNEYTQTIKGDHNFNDSQRLSVRYTRAGFSITRPNLWGNWMNPAGGASPRLEDTDSGALDYTHTISPTTVLTLRWGVSREVGYSSARCGECEFDPRKDLGFQGDINAQLPPRFGVEGYSAVGPDRNAKITRGEDVNHLIANVSTSRGRHTITAGAEARLYRLNYGQPGVNWADFSFNRRITMQNPFSSNSLQGDGLASLLLGWGSGSQAVRQMSSWAYQSYAGFFQDNFQITPKLTINVGVRYELPVIEKERYNRVSWVDPLAESPLSGRVPQLPTLRGGLRFADEQTRAPYESDTNNWAPRIGFAYQILPKTIVRGGYGIYYGLTRAQMSSPLGLGFSTDTSWVSSLDNGVTQYASLSNPFRDGLNKPIGSSLGLSSYIGQSINGPVRDWSTSPYNQQWSLSIQRELPANSVAEIAYSGSRGVHLGFGGNSNLNRIDQNYYSLGTRLNEVVPNPFYGVITDPVSALSKPTVTRMQLLRPYPHFTGVDGYPAPPTANSSYHALQSKFTKRYSHNLSLSGHYTFSKMIDDNSLSASGMSWMGGGSSLQNYSNLRLERAVSVFDITHRAVMDFACELPVGRGRALGGNWNRWVDGFLGGWQVNGILTIQSGSPLLPSLASGVLPDASQRPNLLFEPNLPGSVTSRLNGYLNPDAFSRPAAYTYGNAPRTLSRVRAPGSRGNDFSLLKSIYFSSDRERYLQIRAEAFNAANTPVFGAPNMTVGSTSFGVISGQANSPRDLQLALKLYF